MTKGKGSNPYKNEAKKKLENLFPRISCAAIGSVLKHVDFQFPEAFRLLEKMSIGFPNDENAKVRALPTVVIPVTTKVFLKKDRAQKPLTIRDKILLSQLEDIPELNTKENNPPPPPVAEDKDQDDDAAPAEVEIECGCCYGDFPPAEMKECSANKGHQVCQGCIYRFVSEQLDGNDSVQFHCIVDDQCKHDYPLILLDEVLSPKLKKRTNERVFMEQVKLAGLSGQDDAWTCPQCAHFAIKGGEEWFYCPSCLVAFCGACNEEYHNGQTCDEVRQEKARLTNPVQRAQEAMTQAVKRTCPHCSIEYQKHDGCNKITCKGCKKYSCYLCQAKIKDYSHFHLGKCQLWTNTKKMEARDRKARRAAGEKVLQEAGMPRKEILRVIASPPKIKTRAKAAVAQPRRVQALPPPPPGAGNDDIQDEEAIPFYQQLCTIM